ncbi:MAG: hypothetical protein AAFY33_07800 [Cyanobacteria bacterium J06643_4]
MSFLATTSPFQKNVRCFSKIAVGSAIAFTISSLPTIAHAQSGPSVIEQSVIESQQTTESFSTVSQKIARLNAAVAAVENIPGEDAEATREKIDSLKRLAIAYSSLGEQSQAVALLDRAVQIARDSASAEYPTSPIRIVQTYIRIGEPEAAETLLTQIRERQEGAAGIWLSRIAEAYTDTGHDERAAAVLTWRVDWLSRVIVSNRDNDSSDSPEFLNSRVGESVLNSIGILADDYSKLADPIAAQAGLARLTTLMETVTEEYGTDDMGSLLIRTLSQLAKAHGQQGDTEMANVLLARAMEQMRREEGRPTAYTIALTAEAYGHLGDRTVSEQALAELTQITVEGMPSPDQVVFVYEELGAIAGAYNRIGNSSQAQQTIAPIIESANAGPFILSALIAYSNMTEVGQEVLIQTLFDQLPLLREAELTISDVTAGYSGITGLVEGYVATTNDAAAQGRLAMLESFFKDIQFDPLGIPAQLGMLARAAAAREDNETAQRLLSEATQMLEADIGLCQAQCERIMSSLIWSYSALDSQARQPGLDRLQQIADDHLDTAQREEINISITMARALL